MPNTRSEVPLSRSPSRESAMSQRLCTYLQMHQSWLSKLLVRCQALVYDRISAFSVQLDPAIRTSDDGRHSFPRRVELANVENLKLLGTSKHINKHRFRFSDLLELIRTATAVIFNQRESGNLESQHQIQEPLRPDSTPGKPFCLPALPE